MVWPFSSSGSSSTSDSKNSGQTSSNDVYSKLDPTLREFLNHEVQLRHDQPVASTNKSTQTKAKPATPTEETPPPSQSQEQPPSAPAPPTLFPDGRYADLWKTYRPQASIEANHKSEQDQLADVLSNWKLRQASIGQAALENCAAINVELDECFKKPGARQLFSACRAETKALDRCVSMNTRFLKTLGYLSSLERTPQQEEEIQMHADRLYTEMLEREQQRKLAKAEGRVAETEENIPLPSEPEPRPPELDQLTERGKKQLEERVKGLNPVERDLEERAFAAEIRAGTETMQQVEKYRHQAQQGRSERMDSGKAGITDRVQSWLGW